MPKDNLVAHRDDDWQRWNLFFALLPNPMGSVDPDALKISARRAEFSLAEDAFSSFQAEPDTKLLTTH